MMNDRGGEGNGMAMPIDVSDVRRALRPWLGALFVEANAALCDELADHLRQYAPYRQSLESLRDGLESLLITRLNGLTRRTMTVATDNYTRRRLRLDDIREMADDLMGVVFDGLTPVSSNFIKLNDYSLRAGSLNAMRVLYQKYASFYTQEELDFLASMIRSAYPRERYAAWLDG